MNTIKAIVKEPGKAPEISEIENTTEAMQKIVRGNLEMVTIGGAGLVIVCNEDAWLRLLPYNCELYGATYVGTIIIVGANGDEYVDVPMPDVTLELFRSGERRIIENMRSRLNKRQAQMLLDGKPLKYGRTEIYIPSGPSNIRTMLVEYVNNFPGGEAFDVFIDHGASEFVITYRDEEKI